MAAQNLMSQFEDYEQSDEDSDDGANKRSKKQYSAIDEADEDAEEESPYFFQYQARERGQNIMNRRVNADDSDDPDLDDANDNATATNLPERRQTKTKKGLYEPEQIEESEEEEWGDGLVHEAKLNPPAFPDKLKAVTP